MVTCAFRDQWEVYLHAQLWFPDAEDLVLSLPLSVLLDP